MSYARRFQNLLTQARTSAVETDHAEPVFVPTPIYIGDRTRAFLLLAIVLAGIWLAIQAPSVPRLLMLGATVGLILSFPVRLLERWMPRPFAIFVVVGSTVAFSIIGLILIVPFAVREISEFVGQVPDIIENFQAVLLDVLTDFRERGWINQDPEQVLADMQGNVLDRGEAIAQTLLTGTLNTLTRSFSIAITTFGVIFIATYLLIDIPRFKERFIHSFSPAYRPDAAQLWFTIGESLSRYLSGLMVSILIQGMMATIGLAILGIPYAVVLGVWMSVTAILPYVGAFLGAIPAVLVALTISWQMALVVVGLYIVINQVEGNLITPRIQGSAVRVHPLIIFVAVIAGGEMAGFLGAVMAVPVLAVLRVLSEFLWVRLQVRQARDTVLVALGGDDDTGSDSRTGESGGAVAIKVGGDGEATVTTGNLDDLTVQGLAPVTVTVFRPRPRVRRRTIPRQRRVAGTPDVPEST